MWLVKIGDGLLIQFGAGVGSEVGVGVGAGVGIGVGWEVGEGEGVGEGVDETEGSEDREGGVAGVIAIRGSVVMGARVGVVPTCGASKSGVGVMNLSCSSAGFGDSATSRTAGGAGPAGSRFETNT